MAALLLAHPTCDPFVLDRKGRTPAEDTSDEEAVLSGARLPTGAMQV